MANAIRIYETGGPEVMRWEDVEVGEPGEGQARIRHTAVGVNYIDTYHRSGLYPLPLPTGLGQRGGRRRRGGRPRRHGRQARRPRGLRRRRRPGRMPRPGCSRPSVLVPIPDGMTDRTAAAVMLKGMTVAVPDPPDLPGEGGRDGPVPCRRRRRRAHRLPVAEGARGDGHRHRRLGREGGARPGPRLRPRHHLRRGRTSPRGCGRSPAARACRSSTTRSARTRSSASLDCLRPLGLMVSFGNASGTVPPFDIGILSQKGSLYLTRPTLATYTATRADLEATAGEVFEVIRDGQGEGRDPAHLPARRGRAGPPRPGGPPHRRVDRDGAVTRPGGHHANAPRDARPGLRIGPRPRARAARPGPPGLLPRPGLGPLPEPHRRDRHAGGRPGLRLAPDGLHRRRPGRDRRARRELAACRPTTRCRWAGP